MILKINFIKKQAMFQQVTPITRNIIIVNVAVFIIAHYILSEDVAVYLMGFFPTSPYFKSWQIITHMFMHGGWSHLLFNMITLWSFGPVLERTLGEKKYFLFYFACGLGSYVIFNLWNLIEVYPAMQTLMAEGINPYSFIDLQNNLENPNAVTIYNLLRTPMVGASGAIFGVVTAFAVLFPNAKLFMMFIPVPIKAKYLLPIVIIGSLVLGVGQFTGDNIAHFAHLGGALIGYLWIRQWKKNQNRNF